MPSLLGEWLSCHWFVSAARQCRRRYACEHVAFAVRFVLFYSYLVSFRYPYERIDGAVRGIERQVRSC